MGPGNNALPGQRGDCLRQVGLAKVDPQKDRSPAAQGICYRRKVSTQTVAQLGHQPVRQIQRLTRAGNATLVVRTGLRWRVALAGKQHFLTCGTRQTQDQPASGQPTAKRRRRGPSPQRIEHKIAHGSPVAGPGKAAGTTPVGQRLFGRLSAQHAIEDRDRCRSTGARRHVTLPGSSGFRG